MEVLIPGCQGNFLLIATDMWDGERKVLGCDDEWSVLFGRMLEMKLNLLCDNYYCYSIFKLNSRVRPTPLIADSNYRG